MAEVTEAEMIQKRAKMPKADDLETLALSILAKSRCSQKIKGNYSKPQMKAIIAGLYDKLQDYGSRIDGLDMALKMMVGEKEYFKGKVSELHKELFK